MSKNSSIDFRVKIAIDSKEYRQALRQANQEAKEFKKQQRDAFKTSGKDANDSLTSIISKVGKLAPAISAATVAYQAVNTAIKENQTLTDEWARVTESAKASYESFVNALVNADLSSWLRNFESIVTTARELADAFDQLDTAKIFNSREMAALRMEAAGYRLTLRTPSASDNEKQAAAAGLKDVREREKVEMQRMSNVYFETFAKEFAARMTQHGAPTNWTDIITKNDNGLWELTKNSKYQTYFATLANYNEANNRLSGEISNRRNTYKWVNGQKYLWEEGKPQMSDTEFADLRAALQISDEKLRAMFDNLIAAYNGQAQYLDTLRSDQRMLGSVSGGGKASAQQGSIAYLKEQISIFQKEWEQAITDAERSAAKAHVEELQRQLDLMTNGSRQKYDSVLGGLSTPIGGVVSADKLQGGKLTPYDTKALESNAKDTTKYIDLLSDSISQLGLTSLSSNEDFSRIMALVKVFLNTVSVLGNVSGGEGGKMKWYDILFGIFGVGKSALGFAGGGIVGGTSYKGDRLPQMVNSKEMIFNAYQQKQLFDLINSGAGGASSTTSILRGEDIYMALSNYSRRTGKKIIIQ